MSKMKIYYKVVHAVGDDLFSINNAPSYIKKYTVGKWVVPPKKGTKLFVFDSLENALSFIYQKVRIYQIYQCLAYNVSKPIRMAIPTDSSINRFWKDKRLHRKYNESSLVPKGTLLCDKLKLLERVR